MKLAHSRKYIGRNCIFTKFRRQLTIHSTQGKNKMDPVLPLEKHLMLTFTDSFKGLKGKKIYKENISSAISTHSHTQRKSSKFTEYNCALSNLGIQLTW